MKASTGLPVRSEFLLRLATAVDIGVVEQALLFSALATERTEFPDPCRSGREKRAARQGIRRLRAHAMRDVTSRSCTLGTPVVMPQNLILCLAVATHCGASVIDEALS